MTLSNLASLYYEIGHADKPELLQNEAAGRAARASS